MKNYRRYTPIRETEKLYHEHFDLCSRQSDILHQDAVPGAYTQFWDKQNMTRELGSKKELLAIIQKSLDGIADDFEYHRQQMHLQGFRRPDKMPASLIDRKFKLEAEFDICRMEIDLLEERLDKFTEADNVQLDKRMLARGLSGGGSLRDGQLVELMGQRISMIDNELVINHPASPYHGLKVVIFRDLAEKWCKAYFRLQKEKRQLTQRLFAKGFTPDEITKEWKTKEKELFQENHEDWKDLFAIKLGKRPLLPLWPKGVEKVEIPKSMRRNDK